ncbi:hypothetical protein ACILD7_02295 [Capnocytophaga canimorsus]|uniref:hypothetical protein n=1 Tax=Capnocytophaga canimorsus TaxID=28188 RepID=UPI0037D1D532
MKVSKKIANKISNNNLFSLEVAKILNKTQQAVMLMAKAQSDRLLHYLLVEFYKSQGFTEDEIFEKTEKP